MSAKELAWEFDGPPEREAVVRANPHLLRLAVDNLVDNAIKFTPPGGYVRLTARFTPTEATFTVADNGCGIPEEDQRRVFERFYQVGRARSGAVRGTGLGLAIVWQAVMAMGGVVSLESGPERGTRVTITLPQTSPDPSDESPSGAETAPGGGRTASANRTDP